MKRVVGIVGVAFIASTGAASAAGCYTSLGASPGYAETIGFNDVLNGVAVVPVGSSESCDVTSTVFIPDGYYGVFRADSRGLANLDTGDGATNSLTGSGALTGQSGSVHATGPTPDQADMFFRKDFATGVAAGSTYFTATAAVATSGLGGPGLESDYDSIDLMFAYTSRAEQQASINQIGLEQLAISTHLDETAGLLTGSNQALEGPNEFGIIGAVGSYTLGVTGRYNLADGFSLLGGASIVNFGVPGANASGVVAAAALRFVQPGTNEFRLMGEVGAQISPLSLTFSRHYEDGSTAGTDASGSGTGILGSAYAKGGVLWSPDADDSLLFSATLKQGALGIGSFVEDDPASAPNLFAADLSGTTQNFTTIKAGTDWTRKLAPSVDLTASLAVGVATGAGASANVFGIGTVTGSAQSTLFADYGLRVGWDVAPGSRVDGFVAGSTGTNIGTHAQIGAAYHMSF